MKKLNLLWTMSALALITAGRPTAQAQVFVKPSGQKAIPLRVQSLTANVEIIGSFAVTNWQMKIQMENVGFGGYRHGGVCDFVVARPTDAKVTAFRVQQWQASLVGRLVEKSLATPRVAFRAAASDPLLKSGLGPNNSFRATIYPVSSWSDVTLHGTWVQVLPTVQGRSTYRLPLLALKGATTRLPQLNAKISVRGGDVQNLSSNYGLPIKTLIGMRMLSLSQRNYRVLRDLTVTVAPKNARQQGAILVTPDAQVNGGHFALALVADSDWKQPILAGRSVGNRDTLFGPHSARTGETVLMSGTYQGHADQLSLRLLTNGTSRGLSVTPVINAAAAALWATQKIYALGLTQSSRSQVIVLSKKFSVASPFTAWLAVNKDDLKVYQRAMVSAQLDPFVREYWMLVAGGRDKTARATRLRKAINQISHANNLQAEDELYIRLGSAYGYVLSQKYSDYNPRTGSVDNPRTRRARKAQAEKRIARLGPRMLRYVSKLTNKKAQRSIDWASPIYGGELYELRTRIVGEYRKPHPDYEQLKTWELRFARLYGSTYIDPRLNFWRAQVTARTLEAQTAAAEQAGDTTRLAQLQKERISNSRNAYFVNNIGDPPIYVSAPADALQVVAIMPDGKVKTLDYNSDRRRWEGNYDVPVTMQEGDYVIQIIIVNTDRSRRRYAMQFRVDTTRPTGQGQVLLAPGATPQGSKHLRLQVEHGGDVARATALLPWGEKVSLLPSTSHGHRFFAVVTAPRQYSGKAIKVTYILIDRAHNLTSIEAESVSLKSP